LFKGNGSSTTIGFGNSTNTSAPVTMVSCYGDDMGNIPENSSLLKTLTVDQIENKNNSL
jgi:hypothetical protein